MSFEDALIGRTITPKGKDVLIEEIWDLSHKSCPYVAFEKKAGMAVYSWRVMGAHQMKASGIKPKPESE